MGVTPYGGRITTSATVYQAQLAAEETRAVVQMQSAYRRVIDTLGSDLENVMTMIRQRQAAGLPTPVSWLHKEQRYSTLILQTKREFESYGGTVKGILDPSQLRAINLAKRHSESLLESSLPSANSIAGTFNSLPAKSLAQLRGTLQPGSPLSDLLGEFGTATAAQVDRALTVGLAKGLHPDQITRNVIDATKIAPARAAVITRTELYRSYREANRGTYAANRNLVEGWVWFAHLGSLTCAACLAMHGTLHSVDEPMGSHPNCRCTMLPQTKSWGDLGFPSIAETRVTTDNVGDAEAWLKTQPPARQIQAFNNRKLWSGWSQGDYKLGDVVRTVQHPDWGTTRTVGGTDHALRAAESRRAAEQAQAVVERQNVAQAAVQRSNEPAWLRDAREIIAGGVDDHVTAIRLGQTIRKGMEADLPKGYAADSRKYTKLQREWSKLKAESDRYPTSTSDALRAKRQRMSDIQVERQQIKRRMLTARTPAQEKKLANLYKVERKHLDALDALETDFGDGKLTLAEYEKRGKAINKKLLPVRDELWNATRFDQPGLDISESALDKLRQVRDFGSTREHELAEPFLPRDWDNTGAQKRLQSGVDHAVKEMIHSANDRYPSEWWDASVERNKIMPGKAARGYHVEYDPYSRAGDRVITEIVTSGRDDFDNYQTIVHELGHRMERAVPKLKQLEESFYASRSRGEPLVNMSWSADGKEKTRLDSWFDQYIGKDYGGRSYEIFTMGVEGVLSPQGVSRGERFVLGDLDHLDFILGVLAGL